MVSKNKAVQKSSRHEKKQYGLLRKPLINARRRQLL